MWNSYNITGNITVKILLMLSVLMLLISCRSSNTDNANQAKKDNTENNQPVAVTIGKSESRDVPAYIQATGSLTANETSDVAPKVAGKVTNVYVNVGDLVGSGKIIAKLDDRDARLRLAEAEANVKQSQAAVRQAEARLGLSANGRFNSSAIPEVRVAAANLDQAQTEARQAEVNLKQAEVNEKRYRELVETGDVAMIQYEQFRTTRDAVRAERDTARSRVNAARQQLEAVINTAKQNNQAIKSAEAAVESARTQIATAQQAIADTIIRTPFGGFVSERPIAVGEFVTSSTSVAKILKTNPIKIEIKIAEADIPQVSIGSGVSIEVDAYKERRFSGSVTAVNPAVDPASRAATIEAQIQNDNNALRAGMFGTARITREGGNTGIFVPKSAVYNDQATQSFRVFVIKEKVAKLKVVQLGTQEDEFYQILSGLEADETVATSNLDKLYEGANVVF